MRAKRDLDVANQSKVSIARIAHRYGLSHDYFTRLFSREVGISPKHYHLRARMRYAQFLLEHSNLNVAGVAREISYSDPYVFSRQFKTIHGYPPSRVQK